MEKNPPKPAPNDIVVSYDNDRVIRRVDANLEIVTFQEGASWIGYCPAIDVSSCGATEKDALKATQDAIALFFVSCIERGTLDDALVELGYVISLKGRYKGSAKRQESPREPRVPAHILQQMKAGNRWSYKYAS
jgi:hypothetical protein